MATRTTEEAVKNILSRNYDSKSKPDLMPFIQSASLVVDRVVTMAAKKNPAITLSTDELESIERWLSAHLYAVMDQMPQSKTTKGVSGSFQVGTLEGGFGSTQYGRTAMDLDYSGCLKNLSRQQRAGGFWSGKPASDQLSWEERN